MYIEAILFMFFLIFFDIRILRKYNQSIFKKIFVVPNWWVLLFVIMAVVILFVPERKSELVCYLILAFVVPLYLLRRCAFIEHDEKRPDGFLEGDDEIIKQYLKFEGFQFSIVWLYFMSVFSAIYHGFVKEIIGEIPEINELMLFAFYSTVMTLVLIYRSTRKFSAAGFWRNLGFKPGVPIIKSFFIPLIIGIFFVGCASFIIISRGSNQPSTPMSESLATAESPVVIIIFLILAILVAPLSEEIVFRGYFYHIFSKVKGKRTAIYVISLTFAVLHVGQYWGDWMAIVMVAMMGFSLTVIRAWTQTTSASVIMHYAYNIGVTIIPVIHLAVSNPAWFEYQSKYFELTTPQKEELLLKSIEAGPHMSEAYNDLAWLYAEENYNLDEALRLVDIALEISPGNGTYLDTKAEVITKMGKYTDAIYLRQEIIRTSKNEKLIELQNQKLSELNFLIRTH